MSELVSFPRVMGSGNWELWRLSWILIIELFITSSSPTSFLPSAHPPKQHQQSTSRSNPHPPPPLPRDNNPSAFQPLTPYPLSLPLNSNSFIPPPASPSFFRPWDFPPCPPAPFLPLPRSWSPSAFRVINLITHPINCQLATGWIVYPFPLPPPSPSRASPRS